MQKKTHKKQAETKAASDANSGQTEDTVKLKPVLGIRPGVWLAVLYSLVLLIVLFFILLYPGLKNPGSMIVLKTEPVGAALRVDGVYRGTAPDRIFVSRGTHTLEAALAGFTAKRIDVEIPGRLFASALLPKQYPLEITLECPDTSAAFAAAAAEYAAWTFGGEPVPAWQVPLSLSDAAYRLGPRLIRQPADTAGLLAASARFAVTRAALRDLVRAEFISTSGGLPPSPAGMLNSSAHIIGFLAENPGSAAWLASLLPSESAALVKNSAWSKTDGEKKNAAGPVSGKAAQFTASGLSFTSMGDFLICNTQVPFSVFAHFLAANPRWKAENREELVQAGLATSAYLAGVEGDASNKSVYAISWHAALAFCQWFRTQLPASMAHNEVRLPAAAEWNMAAEIVHTGGQAAVPWEWSADAFAPLDFFTVPENAAAAVGSPERSLLATPLSSTAADSAETRASLPPEFCSPFVSFRPVIAAVRE